MGIRTARRHALSSIACGRPLAVCRAAAGLTAIAALAACGSSAPTVSLPPKQSDAPVAAASSSAAPTSAKQAVIEAYMAFWPASSLAEKTGNATKAQAILAPYVASTYITYMISGMQSAWAKGEVGWGSSVEHIQSVIVATLNSGEQTAVVKDCQNDSDSGLASAQTGALVPGTLGSAEQELYTSMGLLDGRWLIEQVTFIGDTCTG
jgi:predicted small lipoprotein YifL